MALSPSRKECNRAFGFEARVHPREGDERLSEASQGNPRGAAGDRESRKKRDSKTSGKKVERVRGGTTDVGRVLRTVYDRTLREEVPPDFLDLLGKLG